MAALLAVVSVPLVGATPAHAASYRYWGYYHGTSKGTWAFASTGAVAVKPADGAVEGWRFAVSGASDARYPRVTPSFATVCTNTAAVSGKKRVAVYIDSGLAQETPTGSSFPAAPTAACAVVPSAWNGEQVLASVEKLRESKGLVCAIGGYPSIGCGDSVKKPLPFPNPEPKVAFAIATPSPAPTPTPSATPAQSATPDAVVATPTAASGAATANAATGTTGGSHIYAFVLLAIAAVAVLGGGGLMVARRRS